MKKNVVGLIGILIVMSLTACGNKTEISEETTQNDVQTDMVYNAYKNKMTAEELLDAFIDGSVDAVDTAAKMMNAQFVWIYSSITVLDATLAYSLNHLGVPTLVTEMGVGNRITPKYCRDIVDGIFNLMSHMGIWDDEPKEVNEPIISTEGEVTFLTAKESGIFVSAVDSMGRIGIGTHIGDIIEPIEGRIIQRIESPTDGIIFTLRENPVVHKGALIARVYGGR